MSIEDYFVIDGTYELVDGVYNVKGTIRLNRFVKKLPVKFGNVSGHFDCSRNNLTTLEGAPKKVGGIFSCINNNLTSLDFCPTYVGDDFWCDKNLKSTKEYRKYLIIRKLRQ